MEEIRKITLWITGIIAVFIILACVILTFRIASIQLPTTPVVSTVATEQDGKRQEIANYKELVLSLQNQRTIVFDYVVLKTLLPLFGYIIASVLTYIFTKTALQAYNSYISAKYK
jgi:hypothetical protein